MIEPLRTELIRLLLDAIHCDRTGTSMYNEKSSTIQGVIRSFVSVEEFKKKNNLELYENIFETPFLEATGAYYRLVLRFN
jgi:cullin 2